MTVADVSPELQLAYRLKSAIKDVTPESNEVDLKPIESLLKVGADLEYCWYQDTQGRTPLHHAALQGCLALVRMLLNAGHPYCPLDDAGETPGDLAKRSGFEEVYEHLVEEGVRSMLILGVVEKSQQTEKMHRLLKDEDKEEEEKNKIDGGQDYLKGTVAYQVEPAQGDQVLLVDEDRNAVMMSWERPLMKRHAQIICHAKDLEMQLDERVEVDLELNGQPIMDRFKLVNQMPAQETSPPAMEIVEEEEKLIFNVLNVGFGLGLVDSFIHRFLALRMASASSQTSPRIEFHHHIVEAHPTVLQTMSDHNWRTTIQTDTTHPHLPYLHVHSGTWQEVVPQLLEQGLQFDGIFFDTFGECFQDMQEWHEHVGSLLKQDDQAVYSFFNGFAGRQPFLYDVFQRVLEIELMDMGWNVEWEEHQLTLLNEKTYEQVKRPYYSLPAYRLPICKWKTD